jgi:hypothetical protein
VYINAQRLKINDNTLAFGECNICTVFKKENTTNISFRMLSKDGAQPILSLQILPSADEKYFPFDRGSVC